MSEHQEQVRWGLEYMKREYGPDAVRRDGGFGWKDASPYDSEDQEHRATGLLGKPIPADE